MNNDDEQMDLFHSADLTECELLSPEIKDRIISEEQRGNYTAVRLKKLKPTVYATIVEMLALAIPISKIAEICNVHFYTVAAVCDREPDVIKKAKEKYISLSITNSIITQEKLREMLLRLNPKKVDSSTIHQLATAAGSLIEKASLLAGGATQRVELVDDNKSYNGSAEEFAKRFLREKGENKE